LTKILVADDEPMVREALKKILETEGYDVCEAVNGKDACEAVSRDLPDLVLLDAMMPVMDGFEVLKVLRNNPDTTNLPVVMLTSTPAAVGEQTALEFGVAHYVSKPWRADILQAAVRMALREARNQRRTESTKILLADDEPLVREALKQILENEGYDVYVAADGKDACEAVSRNLPDLVLLDVDMPIMNGFEVLKVLRNNPDTFNLPVVMLTSTPAADGEQTALDFGVAHYVSKPWRAGLVQAAVRTALRSVNAPIPTPPPKDESDESELK